MRDPLVDRDTSDETTLFDPDSVAPKMCGYCNATRTLDCEYDEFLALSIERPVNRPKGCLASAQLAPHEPLPYA